MREERFVQGLLEGRTQKDAAIYAGYSPASAEKRASEKMGSVSFRDKLREYALAQGIGVEYALGKLHNLMEARAVALGGKDKDQVIEMGQDGTTQVKATDLYLKMMGAYPDPRLELNANIAATVIVRAGDMLAPDPFSDGPPIDGEAREISDGA